MEFLKITGSGNDFILIDNRNNILKRKSQRAKKLCDRKSGIGADGMILLEQSSKADFKMRIFNSDGSEAEMCGNGLRCFIRFIKEQKISSKKSLDVETKAGIYLARISGNNVTVKMFLLGKPKNNISISLGKTKVTGHHVDTGVPHTIIFVPDVDKVDLVNMGPKIRYHSIFKPRGTNVDWVELINKKTIKVRTYERGVEAETLSCGTGVVASAVISFLLEKVDSPVNIITASGDTLKVFLADKSLTEILLQGPTTYIFKGTEGPDV